MENRKNFNEPMGFTDEKCSKCAGRAEYICICRERNVCDTCLLKHVSSEKNFNHRPVSMKHPLLTLILAEADEDLLSESEPASDQVEKLQMFKDRSINMVDKKIRQLLDMQEKSTLRKSVNKTSDTLKMSEPSISPSPAIDLASISKSPPLKKEDLSTSQLAQSARIFNRPSEVKYKIIIVGDTGVGKTTLMSTFRKTQKVRSGFVNNKVTGLVKVEGISFLIDLWDLSGTEKYSALSKMCVSGAAAAIVLFDLNNELSLWSIDKRLESLKEEADVLSVLALVGNKIDVSVKYPKKRFISFDRGQEIAASKGMIYEEISAEHEGHVLEMVKRIVKEIWARKIPNKNKISLFY
jgi:small GTP-binding protein